MSGLLRPVVDQQEYVGDDCGWLQGKLKHRDRTDGHELPGLTRRAVILAAPPELRENAGIHREGDRRGGHADR